jgi:hypothetical protein
MSVQMSIRPSRYTVGWGLSLGHGSGFALRPRCPQMRARRPLVRPSPQPRPTGATERTGGAVGASRGGSRCRAKFMIRDVNKEVITAARALYRTDPIAKQLFDKAAVREKDASESSVDVIGRNCRYRLTAVIFRQSRRGVSEQAPRCHDIAQGFGGVGVRGELVSLTR